MYKIYKSSNRYKRGNNQENTSALSHSLFLKVAHEVKSSIDPGVFAAAGMLSDTCLEPVDGDGGSTAVPGMSKLGVIRDLEGAAVSVLEDDSPIGSAVYCSVKFDRETGASAD